MSAYGNPYQLWTPQPAYPVPQPFQPMQPQQTQAVEIDGVRWVSSMDEVNGTVIGFGKTAFFMFTGENAFAVKSVSASGVPTVKVFDFVERTPPAPVTPEGYVTREEFDKLKEQINGQPVNGVAAAAPAAAVNAAEPGSPQYHGDGAGVPGYPPAGPGAVLQPGGPDGMDPFAAQ